ncbi:MAG: hypothetical protein RL347_461 [Actinomycetota bacterium]|jgi:uncharacterized protein (TIGR03089 family)
MTPYVSLLDRVKADPSSPMVTFRDLGSGERMELSSASLANAIAKTAGLLRDELDAEPGAVVGVHLPLHWQRVVWLGACAATGTVFAPGLDPSACDICVVDRPHLDLCGYGAEDVLVSLAPFGLPEPGAAPAGVTDAAVAMRAHPDTFTPYDAPDPARPWVRWGDGVLAQGQVMERARELLAARGLGTERFAVVDPDPDADLLALAGPLVTGSGVVIIARGAGDHLSAVLAEEGIGVAAG